MLNIEEMIKTDNFEALLVANEEDIRLSGGMRYILNILSKSAIKQEKLNEILLKHMKEYPELFNDFFKQI